MTSWKSLVTAETETQFRQLWSYFYEQVSIGKAKTGVVAGLAVTPTTPSPSGSVAVATGLGLCQPTTGGGAYPLPNTSGTLDIFTANPMQFVGNPRNDIIVLDQTDGQVKALIGTPNATASLGEQTVPSTAIPLSRLRHAPNATTIPADKMDDLRVTVNPVGVESYGPWINLAINTAGGWSAGSLPPMVRYAPGGWAEFNGGSVTAGPTVTRNDPFAVPASLKPSIGRHLPTVRTTSSTAGRSAAIGVFVDVAGAFTFGYTEPGGLPVSVGYPVVGRYLL